MNWKKYIRYTLFAIICSCLICCNISMGVSAKNVNCKKIIRFSKSTYVLKQGSRYKLKAKILKSKYKKKKIIWSSSRSKIATVSKKGVVKAKKKGSTTITARVKGTRYRAKCKIIVRMPVKKQSLISKNETKPTTPEVIKPTLPEGTREEETTPIAPEGTREEETTPTVPEGTREEETTPTVPEGTREEETQPTVPENTSEEKTQPTVPEDTSEESTSPVERVWDARIYDQRIASMSSRRKVLLAYMEKYTSFLKFYGHLCVRQEIPSVLTFSAAYHNVVDGKKIGINCASPLNWALYEMGIQRTGEIHGTYYSGFYIGEVYTKSNLERYAEFLSQYNGMNIQNAAMKGVLRAGDMISVRRYDAKTNYTVSHTAVYYGMMSGKAYMYEAGRIPYTSEGSYSQMGCGPIDYSQNAGDTITEIIRFKD